MKPEIVQTQRLVLRGYSPAHIRYIFEQYPKEEIMRLLGHRSEEDYRREEYKQLNGYATYNRSFLLFLLEDKASGLIIGRCGLHNWNVEHRRSEIGYVMEDDNFKQKGLMTEALGVVITYGFNTLYLNRLEALVATDNVASLRLMQHYGFRQEGILKQHLFRAGQSGDSVLFALLQEEYAASRR